MKDKGMTRADDPKTDTPTTADETLEKESGEQDDKSKDDRREPEEVGGPRGPEPTRYGDWERKGRCIDF